MSDFDNMHNPDWDRIKDWGINAKRQQIDDYLSDSKSYGIRRDESNGMRNSISQNWSIHLDFMKRGVIYSKLDGETGVLLVDSSRELNDLMYCIGQVLSAGAEYNYTKDSGTVIVVRPSHRRNNYFVIDNGNDSSPIILPRSELDALYNELKSFR